jgi:hypothetical protein
VVFVSPGKQPLTITFEGGRDVSREIVVAAGATIEEHVDPPAAPVATPTPPPATPAPTSRPALRESPGGLSPAVVIVGGVLTLGLAGTGVWSGITTNHAHDDYVANPTHAGWEAGRTKQLRTNILFGSAAGVGVATIAIAIFWTRRHRDDERPTIAIIPGNDGVGLAYGSRF